MTDHVSRVKRSSLMSAVRGKNTTPEKLVRRAAHRLGLRFRLYDRRLPGRPDLVFPRWRTVIFVNGCFWHGHPGCRRAALPKSRVGFWKRKLKANAKRDAVNYAHLKEMGWKVVILWECQLGRPGTLDKAERLLRMKFRQTR